MPYPVIYNVTYSYTAFQQSQGNNSFPGTQIDADFAGLQASLQSLDTFTQGVMRSDGALKNGVVTYDSLAPALQTAGLAPATAWLTGTVYAAGASVIQASSLYRALVAHTSGVFATDLAAGKWLFVSTLTSFGAAVSAFLATPTSANLAAALTDEIGTGFVVFSNAPAGTQILGALSLGGAALGGDTLAVGGSAHFGNVLVQTATASGGFTVGPSGLTNPSFNVDASTTSAVTGLNVKSAASGAGVALSTTSSVGNENLTVDAKGTGTITIGGTSTGATIVPKLTVTTINGNTFTAGTGILTIAAAKTLNVSNTLTLAGTDSSSLNIGAGGTLAGSSSAAVFYDTIPQNSQSAAYALVLADAQKHILHPTADNNARTFTIPANASVAYPIGTAITFVNQINTVTIAITTDTMTLAGAGTTGSRTLAANGIATALKITATSWIISGTGLT